MDLRKWFRLSVINLMVLALAGCVLRYKIAFSLEWIDQKHLLHGHSHFAFSGWLSQAIMVLLVAVIQRKQENLHSPKYNLLLWINLISAYGMFISFILQGYGAVSITFSTLSIFNAYVFAWLVWKDLPATGVNGRNLLIRAALVFNVLSSLGAFALALMMATHTVHQNWYLASIYFFLHFQYNGWFLLSCLAFLYTALDEAGIHHPDLAVVARYFVIACVPTYFLSTLWMDLPVWLYVIVVAASLLQVYAGFILFRLIIRHGGEFLRRLQPLSKTLLILSALAFAIKLCLQAGSTIPALSTWAFGFRPIVIGYLHLVLLGVITLFLFAYAIQKGFMSGEGWHKKAVMVFVIGIVLNEALLFIQGLGAISMRVVPFTNEMLLGAATCMFCGLALYNLRSSA